MIKFYFQFYFNENKKCINYEMGYIIKEND